MAKPLPGELAVLLAPGAIQGDDVEVWIESQVGRRSLHGGDRPALGPGPTLLPRAGDETFRAPIPGCGITITGSFKRAAATGAAAERLHQAFESRKWQELPEFSADGHDGTSFAFRKGDAACFVRGEWDGGADDEPEIPAADPYKVIVVCGKAAMFVRTR
jgi:hypothetical protein